MPAWRTISLWMDQLDDPLHARPALEHDLDVNVAIIGAGYTGLAHVADVAVHLILPVITLALFYMAGYARLTRASMLEVLKLAAG